MSLSRIKGESGMIAKVVVENAAYSLILLLYQVPPAMQEDIRPGVGADPFGKSNRARQGLVMSLEEGKNQNSTHPDAVGLKSHAQ